MSNIRPLGVAGSRRPTLSYLRFQKSATWTGRTKSTLASATSENPASATSLPPHSLLPTKMLLRSLLVSTVSSHRWLLTPALKFLSLIVHPTASPLDVDKSPILRQCLKATFYNHFCAGENGPEVRSTIRNIKDMGFKGVILTYAREIVVDGSKDTSEGTLNAPKTQSPSTELSSNPDIEAWKQGVLETVEMLGKDDILALKLTGAGETAMHTLSATQPLPDQMMSALREICSRAIERKARIFIDAEQQSVQLGIDAVAIDLMRQFNTDDKAVVYNTYQAYLKSTPATILCHLDDAATQNYTLGIKLVRGAYINSEPRELINDTKPDTDASYNSITEGIIKRRFGSFGIGKKPFPSAELFLATHNKESALLANKLTKEQLSAGLPATKVQYGQLLGMADGVSCRLLQLGDDGSGVIQPMAPEVFKCLSWGKLGDCLSYLLRRAIENRDAVGRTKEEYLQIRQEVARRVKRSFV